MAVSGLLRLSGNHAESAVRMSLAAIDEIEQFNIDNKFNLSARIGINSGPVIGGVIGKSRFMYDMWGDTVNVASRMETSGVDGQVQVSEATYDLVKLVPDLKFEPQGELEVKGKGKMSTWLVNYAEDKSS